MTEKELAVELTNWFKTVKIKDKNFLKRNLVAKVLKDNLKNWDYWKNKSNGRFNAQKGYKKMQYILATKNGFEGEFQE